MSSENSNGFINGFKELPIISGGPLVHHVQAQDPIIGIDLGTTNSLVAIVDGKNPKILAPSNSTNNLVPSIVYFKDAQNYLVGNEAKEFKKSDPTHTIYSAKRLLGKGQADLADLQKLLPYSLSHSTENNILIDVHGKLYSPIEISALILKKLKAVAEENLNRTIEDAVITVPAYFNDSQRQATRQAGRLAGLNVLRIINEPTAASLAFGLHHKKNGIIAVYDLGGGTFDISILHLKNGIFEVLATNGNTQLGGDDIDQLIANFLINKYKLNQVSLSELLLASEDLKKQFSNNTMAKTQAANQTLTLTHDEFAKIVLEFLAATAGPVNQALKDANINKNDLTDVVLVGGPTRLPVVQKFVGELLQCTPNQALNPDEVVALGAAIQADILAGNNHDLLLLDVVPLSLGIETFGGAMTSLIAKNTRIPCLAKEQFTTYVDGQTNVAINVYQGERSEVVDNRCLAQFILKGIPALPAGLARIEVSFLVDADGILSVTAREIGSGLETTVEVNPKYGLNDAMVEKMLSDSIANQTNDQLKGQLIEACNDSQKVINATQKALLELAAVLEPNNKAKIQSLVDSAQQAIVNRDLAQIKASHQALNHATVDLAEKLMNFSLEKNLKNKSANVILDQE